MRAQARERWQTTWQQWAGRLRAPKPRSRRWISGAAGVAIALLLTAVAVMPRMLQAGELDALANGGFEHGFQSIVGCGDVGSQWQCFTNGGAAAYGFYDDQWELVVHEGQHSQLIEINTKNMAAGDNDRYAGIYQTARVVPHAKYKLSLRGMIRTTNAEGDPWRYSVQVGWVSGPHGDWRDVTNWADVGWNTYYPRTSPGAFSAYETHLVPDSELITVFVRVWKKWGVAYEEIDVNLDSIRLTGPSAHRPMPKGEMPMMGGVGGPMPETRPTGQMPMGQGDMPMGGMPMGQPMSPERRPMQPMQWYDDESLACGGPDLVYNGSFEHGFVGVPWGDVGRGWGAFTNGGAANYGFYDEQWDVVVADGKHGQLIEINSKAVYPTDADRYAGIYQRIGGLHPGKTYELTLRGLLRGTGNEEDPYRFAAQWGLGKDGDFRSVDEWTTMDLGPIYVRTEPGPLAQYKVRFEAPAASVALFIRGWKKFAITDVEMDFNLDAIRLQACEPTGKPQMPMGQMPMGQMPMGQMELGRMPTGGPSGGMGGPMPSQPEGASCLVVVKPGDMLGRIAQQYGVSMDAIQRANGIRNADTIYVGQKLEIPGCNQGDRMGEMPMREPRRPAQANMTMEMPMQPTQQPMTMGGERPTAMPRMSGPSMRPGGEMGSGMGGQMGSRTYTVQAGDMLTQIALDHGVDAYALATANGINNLNLIYVGQVLSIP